METTYTVSGMTCGHCVSAVREEIGKLEGVSDVQVDLPTGTSGLRLVTRVLDGIDDIHFATLTSDDVVRHSLVGRIVDAYTKYDEVKQARRYEREQTDKPQPGPADRPRRKR